MQLTASHVEERGGGAPVDDARARAPTIDRGRGFFAALPVMARAHDTFDAANYRSAPDDWLLVVTDIVDSTGAIAQGRHKTVNFVAATAIAALRNLCAPVAIPFLFGGDGAVVMVPPEFGVAARVELARVRALAAREFGLTLRVGMIGVGELRGHGCDVQVGRYEPSPGNSFGVFLGGGVGVLEAALKGRGDARLEAAAAIPDSLDDGAPANLEGLSCRWDELRSTRGKMVTLIVHGALDQGEIYRDVTALAAPEADARPVRLETLRVRWPPRGLLLEARAQRRGGSLAWRVLSLLVETAIGAVALTRGRPIGGFDPLRYRREITTNTDFCKHDQTLCFVVDCAHERIAAIEGYFAARTAGQRLRYGMHVSDTALMTCVVTSVNDGLHVHFVDGGGGGYTRAARNLRSAAA